MSLLLGYIGYESIWVIGDEFVANNANQYFKEACNTLVHGSQSTGTHCGDRYEIKLFHAMQYVSHIKNFLG